MKALWQEIDHYLELKWECLEDNAQHQKAVEKERIYSLAGLNPTFEHGVSTWQGTYTFTNGGIFLHSEGGEPQNSDEWSSITDLIGVHSHDYQISRDCHD